MKKTETNKVFQAFNIAIQALKIAGLEHAEVNLVRIQSKYEWSTRFSKKASFVLTVNSAKVDINFRTLKVDCLTIGYLQHEVKP
jgi:hypothetical protein